MIDLSILGTTMRMAAPILLAGTGALYNDRAGTTNITLEGTMLVFKAYRLFEQSFSSQYRFWAIC